MYRKREVLPCNNCKITRASEVQESTQNIEDDLRDMMPTSEEFYDLHPEPYEPSPYDGTYSEM